MSSELAFYFGQRTVGLATGWYLEMHFSNWRWLIGGRGYE
jgi:hypothetical protein